MRMKLNKINKIILLIALGLFFPYKGISSKGFAVVPAIVETFAEPQKVKIGTFTVVNNEDGPVTVSISIENWLKRKGYKNELSSIAPDEWLKIEPESFEMEPGSSKFINYYIHIPENLEGELVAMVYFVPKAKEKKSFIQSRFGVCVYAGIRGTERFVCEISSTTVNVVNSDEVNKSINFTAKVKNTGNVHVRPEGSIIIFSEGKKIKEIKFYKGKPIYPGRSHVYSKQWKNADLPEGKYTAQAVINYGRIYNRSISIKGKNIVFSINDEKDN